MTNLIKTIYETAEWPKFLHGCYNYCRKEEATSYKMQRPSHNQPYCIHSKDSKKYLEEGLKRKLRMNSEKISLDLGEKKELEMQLEC
jgi:hypothetical protein